MSSMLSRIKPLRCELVYAIPFSIVVVSNLVAGFEEQKVVCTPRINALEAIGVR
jgi:hypothetical protein